MLDKDIAIVQDGALGQIRAIEDSLQAWNVDLFVIVISSGSSKDICRHPTITF
jgi:hypothetical protein